MCEQEADFYTMLIKWNRELTSNVETVNYIHLWSRLQKAQLACIHWWLAFECKSINLFNLLTFLLALQRKFPNVLSKESLVQVSDCQEAFNLAQQCLSNSLDFTSMASGICDKCEKEIHSTSSKSPLSTLSMCLDHYFCVFCHCKLTNKKFCPKCTGNEEQRHKSFKDNFNLPKLIQHLSPSSRFIQVFNLLKQEPTESFAIFSRFSTAIQLLQAFLLYDKSFKEVCGSRPVYLINGDVKVEERTNILKQASQQLSIILFTVRTGGVGLNLVFLTRAVFLDPSFNPFTENQARDRLHRIGQTKPVATYKLQMESTLKEKTRYIAGEKERRTEEALSLASRTSIKPTLHEMISLLE